MEFNDIDELIRGNQNRIHSMALLHKKLNISEDVNEVNVKRYITELSELVKDSYDSYNKKVNLFVDVNIEKISLEKSLPLGLIMVELISNSMKHAFKKQRIGIISIELAKGPQGNTLYYSDNGSGFDFNATSEKGLGQEIIKGLIDQLDGVTETKSDNGFELTVWFRQFLSLKSPFCPRNSKIKVVVSFIVWDNRT
ncbi:MAG: sensor histidine kinase, partial [Leadbetterella sp.]|nr:sensor histidine kinase [Leadbetterella sp.]